MYLAPQQRIHLVGGRDDKMAEMGKPGGTGDGSTDESGRPVLAMHPMSLNIGIPKLGERPLATETSRWLVMAEMLTDINDLSGPRVMAAVLPGLTTKTVADLKTYVSLKPETRKVN